MIILYSFSLKYICWINTIIKLKLMQVYSHHPCEKPLMEGFLLNWVKDLFK